MKNPLVSLHYGDAVFNVKKGLREGFQLKCIVHDLTLYRIKAELNDQGYYMLDAFVHIGMTCRSIQPYLKRVARQVGKKFHVAIYLHIMVQPTCCTLAQSRALFKRMIRIVAADIRKFAKTKEVKK